MSNYDSDDAFPKSPGLAPFRPKATPSISPPPFIPQQNRHPYPENVSPSSLNKRKKPNRRKTRPSQGDTVLVSFMAPNRPDIARLVGERALNSDSESEADEEVDDMEDPPSVGSDNPPSGGNPGLDLRRTAQAALQSADSPGPKDTRTSPPRRESVQSGCGDRAEAPLRPRSDSVNAASSNKPTAGARANGDQPHVNGAGSASKYTFEATSPKLTGERLRPLVNGYPHEYSLATSPNLRELTIPQAKGSPRQTLPALQNPSSPRDGPNGSPNQKQTLPGFRQLSELAEAANEQREARANGYPHRHSFSSVGTGQSPVLVSRHYSTSTQRSPPGSAFPSLSATSPISAHSDISSQDPFLRSGQSHHYFFNRRPSQASDNGPPYGPNLPLSASTADSYQSSDSFALSPGSTDPGHRMSIDEAVNNHRTLPPPTGPHIQHIPPHGASGFKCDHPGCTAPPFQTQYLLNSHANVHSQTRPHFCSVSGCPRAEGGKGFKRKNEMIRHGLVHASPGYVCPFCPDREHKYPRPDNLQRHVRVHHVDKDKDDQKLREVLAQRPEGGSRGRRRRAGSG